MVNLYLDESGSMTCDYSKTHPYFVVSILYAKNITKLKRLYKRFVSKNLNRLKIADSGKMFRGEDFHELKGSEFTPSLKKDFINFFSKDDSFQLFYIEIDNEKVESKYYKNTARAFNYIVVLALKYFIKHGFLPKGEQYQIQIDERNQRADARKSLEDYLYSELYLADATAEGVDVTYFDSANNIIIQRADVFANIYYSELRTGNYSDSLNLMKNNRILTHVFKFPLHK